LYTYAVYKPSDGDARIKSGLQEIYYDHKGDKLHAAVDTYLIDITWVQRMSWKNNTDVEQTHTYTHTTGLTITKGKEVTAAFPLGAAYEGASLSIDHHETVFKKSETTEKATIRINLRVPPYSRLILYQKRYRFRDRMFFILYAWNQRWNVGSWGSYEVLRKECEVEIMTEDFVTQQAELRGTGTIHVETVKEVEGVKDTRKRDDCTGACKDRLDWMRL
jgi:hypothetical protein